MKRRALFILLLLVAGAIVNVAMAWLVETRWPNTSGNMLTLPPSEADAIWRQYFERDPARAAIDITRLGSGSHHGLGGPLPDPPSASYEDRSAGLLGIVPELNSLNALDDGWWYAERYTGPAQRLDMVGVARNHTTVAIRAVGWPRVALSHASKIDEQGFQTHYDEWNVGCCGLRNPLPLRPIWPGFAINTVFYAFILWVLFAAPFALRRRQRIKRGLCPKCAYPVSANEVCAECGATRMVKTR